MPFFPRFVEGRFICLKRFFCVWPTRSGCKVSGFLPVFPTSKFSSNPVMDTNTLTPAVAAVTLTSVAAPAQNRNLSTDPERLAVIKVWDSIMREARKYCEEHGFVTVHSMPHIVGVTSACENTDTLFTVDWYEGKMLLLPQRNQLYREMLTQAIDGMARVAQFILGQTDVQEGVPFLINRDNVL
ncbi:MAG: hypothetical protein EOO62_13385 [Hymenobacter sp.]|nr:MAG: hypothetical protein EOO62_13385 [Hymenobacter sp.]